MRKKRDPLIGTKIIDTDAKMILGTKATNNCCGVHDIIRRGDGGIVISVNEVLKFTLVAWQLPRRTCIVRIDMGP